jgi:hypothetical protein
MTPRRAVIGVALALVAVAAWGCGSSSRPATASGRRAGFAWLEPLPAPASWRTGRLAIPHATIALPPGWRRIRGDRGTFSAERIGPRGHVAGYLNLTPRQAGERLATWAAFRPAHNLQEGNRAVAVRAVSRSRQFGAATVDCVQDDYTTSTQARYRELACLFVGARGGVVLVGAAPPSAWRRVEPSVARVIESLWLR